MAGAVDMIAVVLRQR